MRMKKNASSFRDPSGFVFELESELYRSVSREYSENFDFFVKSGLRDFLFTEDLLIKHDQVSLDKFEFIAPDDIVLKPERLPFISYPYEWCFSQLKSAAILTLEVLKSSLDHGMILKDGSAFNVQFKGCKPVFIDTLSFEIYKEGQPWSGYKQFCEHFLAPLCLAAYIGPEFQFLCRLGIDGISLKMASKMLPLKTWLTAPILFHIHLHAKSVDYYSDKATQTRAKQGLIPKRNLIAMIHHLTSFIKRLELKTSHKTQWQNYDQQTHYSKISKEDKASLVREFVDLVNPSVVWDVGSNDGFFSRAVSNDNRLVLSLDSDSLAVEKNYAHCIEEANNNVFPLLMDMANPTPGMGWANRERTELAMRSRPELIMALAVIHHLVINNNIPFELVADNFAELADWLVIEFVPENDEKIIPLPSTAGKLSYNQQNFKMSFLKKFTIEKEKQIEGSGRTLLLLKRRQG